MNEHDEYAWMDIALWVLERVLITLFVVAIIREAIRGI